MSASALMVCSLAAKKAWRSRKLRALVTGRDAKCSRCGGQRDNLHDPYCYDCHVAHLRRSVSVKQPGKHLISL